MQRSERDSFKAARIEAAKHGATATFIERDKGNHSKIRVTVGKVSQFILLCSTPRSDNQPHWAAQHVRRIVREARAA